ncbi:MAG: phosphate/phosphite/phosphonate ABC transporter substrate-binding protein [Pseudomonadota bacterium]
MSLKKPWRFALTLIIFGLAASATAREYTIAIHPVLPEAETRQRYQPLVQYLSQTTDERFRIVTNSNFLTHWQTTKRGEYDLIIDGPQFTGYRLEKLDYTIVVKFPNVVSYTLVTGEDEFIMEANELIGKRIATTPSPALGALRLQQLFPNPLRQPLILETDNSDAAAQRVLEGEAHAAIIPAPMVGTYSGLITVRNTAQVPAPAISASPDVESDTVEKLRNALLNAHKSEAGRTALEAINIEGFESSDGSEYRPHAELLKGMWQY